MALYCQVPGYFVKLLLKASYRSSDSLGKKNQFCNLSKEPTIMPALQNGSTTAINFTVTDGSRS